MIHVLITVKPSVRFPGKNRRLFHYTAIWLAYEIMNLQEPVQVWTVGARGELPEHLPPTWRHIQTATGTHKGDIEEAMRQIAPNAENDIFVLLQLTQPVRRAGLLANIVDAAFCRGVAVSASTAEINGWRTLSGEGSWDFNKTPHAKMIDGACYAWRPRYLEEVFDPEARHGYVMNTNGIVDVDYKSDLPAGLAAMWAETLLK